MALHLGGMFDFGISICQLQKASHLNRHERIHFLSVGRDIEDYLAKEFLACFNACISSGCLF